MPKTIFEVTKDFLNTAKNPLIVITGPTCSGKTNASLSLAQKINGEIINADSRQIFKGLDIITAKIKPEETQNIPHHLFSIIDPNQEFNVTQWKKAAEKKAQEILQKNKIPILCGGTGLFINAIVKNFQPPSIAPQKEFRQKMEKLSNEQLWQKLKSKELKTTLHPNNRRYLIRRLEIINFSKNNHTPLQGKEKFKSLIFASAVNRQKLYKNINQRVEEMFKMGCLQEIKSLLKKGFKRNDPGMFSHGVPETLDFLENKISYQELISKMQQNTRNYAKRQLTWWRRNPRVIWFKVNDFSISDKSEF